MKRKLICASTLLALHCSFAHAQLPPGDPEVAITSCEELQDINNNLAGNYYLANDIDCAGFYFDNANLGFMPIGDADTPFTGKFDGQGFTISNVVINRPSMNYVGVFGYAGIRNGATDVVISDVNLTGIEITGNSHVGGLFGQLYDGTIENINTEGTVRGNVVLGGLGGDAVSSSISHASSSGSVIMNNPTGNTSQIFYGGLIGGNERSEISCSSSDAEVTGNYRVGGLVGNNSGTITNSFATGAVEGFYRVGGLAGENVSGEISDCFATGSVTGIDIDGLPDSHELGGLVGLQFRDSRYADGSEPIIMNSYATGKVTGGYNMGGVLGRKLNVNDGICSDTYWDVETSEISGDACGSGSSGLTTDEMQDQDTYVDGGWDDFDETWIMDGYPVLQCSHDSGNTCVFSIGENDTVVFDGTGAEFGDDPVAFFPTVEPYISGTSLQFEGPVGIGKKIYVKYPLTAAETISADTEDVTFTVSINTTAYGNDSDIFVGITDGTNVLWTGYGNWYHEIPPGILVGFPPLLSDNRVHAVNATTVLLPSSAYLPWQIRFTLSDTSSSIMTSVDSKCWAGDLDGLDRSAGLELLIGMGGGGFDWIQIDTLKVTADLSPVINTAIATLQEARDKVDELDSSVFSKKNNRKNLIKGIDEVISLIDEGLYTDALSKLEGGSILGKTDECAESGAPDKNDWIQDCASQEEVYELLMQAVDYLEDM